ncbi:hypothetical protein Bbelb_134760 [Branchiostoma belcheri]|nr:hypothetical protein Bbelb_134760 [Branchiostoma belcheri]
MAVSWQCHANNNPNSTTVAMAIGPDLSKRFDNKQTDRVIINSSGLGDFIRSRDLHHMPSLGVRHSPGGQEPRSRPLTCLTAHLTKTTGEIKYNIPPRCPNYPPHPRPGYP